MSNSLKWSLKVKLEDLEIPPVSLAMKIMMATWALSAGAEPAGQTEHKGGSGDNGLDCLFQKNLAGNVKKGMV